MKNHHQMSDLELNQLFIDPIYSMAQDVAKLKEQIPEEQLRLYSILTFVTSSINGGIQQYFMNVGFSFLAEIQAALDMLGEGKKIPLLNQAYEIYQSHPNREKDEAMTRVENEFRFLDLYEKAIAYMRRHSGNFKRLKD